MQDSKWTDTNDTNAMTNRRPDSKTGMKLLQVLTTSSFTSHCRDAYNESSGTDTAAWRKTKHIHVNMHTNSASEQATYDLVKKKRKGNRGEHFQLTHKSQLQLKKGENITLKQQL